jgi:hypothetical protein
MRRVSPFSLSIHGNRSNLELENRSMIRGYAGMQAPVTVFLRPCNIIFESGDDWFVILMNYAEGGITIGFRRNNDSESKQVLDFIQAQPLTLHFRPHPGRVLHPV